MAVIAITSAKGSPGTTTAAQALTATWPGGAALVDVDPAGGDVLWRCRADGGAPLDPDRGFLSLAAAARRGATETTLGEHLQTCGDSTRVLVGVSSPEQLGGIGGAWSQIPDVFAAHDNDVIVDCGRVVPGSPTIPILAKADLVVFVVRPDLEGVAHLRDRLRTLNAALESGGRAGPHVAIMVATSYRDTQAVPDLKQLLASEGVAASVVGIFATDQKAARILASTRVGDFRRTLLGRSAKSLVEEIGKVMSGQPLAGMN